MSTNWGPAVDAEIAYRHEQIRSDFRRPWRFKAGRNRSERPIATTTGAGNPVVVTTPAVELPLQRAGSTLPAGGDRVAHDPQHVRAA